MAIAVRGQVMNDSLGLIDILVREHKVELFTISNDDRALEMGTSGVPRPAEMPEWLSPIVSIIPGQLFSMYLTKAKGFDTESPRRLNKVTETL